MNREEIFKELIKSGKYPTKLYKYRPISSQTLNIIQNNNLWFSSPNNFNDPFDCAINSQNPMNPYAIRQFLIDNSNGNLHENEINRIIEELLRNPNELNRIVNKAIKNRLNQVGILCLSKEKDDPLAWAHYCQSHTGICLEFELEKDPLFFDTLLCVKYQDNYPAYDHFQNQSQFLELMISTKSKHWSYENEYRVLKLKYGLYNFSPKALKKIIFGFRCTEKNQARIYRIIKKNSKYSEVTFEKEEPENTSYSLIFKRLTAEYLEEISKRNQESLCEKIIGNIL